MPEGGADGVPTDGADPPPSSTPGLAGAPGAPGSPGTPGLPTKTTREIAREALEAAGLAKPPPSARGPRRLILFSIVILVVLAILVVASLFALDHLKIRTTTTTTLPSSTVPTSTSSSTTTSLAATGQTGVSPLAAYAAASRNELLLRDVGAGGQPLPFERTASRNFVTDPAHEPFVVYWWNGTCAPCAAENFVVVSALESLGGTFTGLSTTTETGGIATIDLLHASYHGPVVLLASEVDGPNGLPDQGYTHVASAQFETFDRPPYTKIPGGYPFLDVGGRFVEIGPGFAQNLLKGLSVRTIAHDLASPDLAVTRDIDGSADELAAAICVTLHELSRPRPLLCANPSIAAIESGLPASPPRAAVGAR